MGLALFTPGDRVGDIVLGAEIGHGGMAAVYRATRGDTELALKLLLPHLAKDPRFTAMFLDEARIASRIRHRNVLQVIDVGSTEGVPYLLMELLRGASFARLLRSARRREQSLPLGVIAAVLLDTARGLHAAHEASDEDGAPLHVVHRDVSPDNIHVGADGVVRVLDFGIAAAAGRISQTRTGDVKGKLAYVSPEQIQATPVDRRADIWALGVVAHEAIAALPLFKRDVDTAARLMSVLHDPIPPLAGPPALAAVVARCLNRDPAERYADCRALEDALRAAFHTDGIGPDANAAAELAHKDAAPEPSALAADMTRPTARRPTGGDVTLPSDVRMVTASAADGRGAFTHTSLTPASDASTVVVRGARAGAARVLLGRDADEQVLAAAIAGGASLITVLGPAGVGKSALVEVALRRAHPAAPTRHVHVAVDDARDSGDLVDRTAAALRVPQGHDAAAVERALANSGPLLLVLDGVDGVLPAAVPTIARWLARAPELCIVTTSRVPLGLDFETVVSVSPLTEDDAVALLRTSAGRRLSTQEEGLLARAVAELGGLPLAILLLGAQLHVSPLHEVLHQVAAGEPVSSEGAASQVAARHRSLPDALAFSLQQLDDDTRHAFVVGGCFRGEIGAADLAAVLGVARSAAAQRARILAERSLWTVGKRGWSVLPPIRAVADTLLRASPTCADVYARHAALTVAKANTAGNQTELRAVIERAAHMPALRALALRAVGHLTSVPSLDGDGLDADVRMLLHGDAQKGDTAAAAAWLAERAWERGRHTEARETARFALRTATAERAVRGRLSLALARAHFGLGDNAAAVAAAHAAIEAAQSGGDDALVAQALVVLGSAHASTGAFDDAEDALLDALDLARSIGASATAAHAEAALGTRAIEHGRTDEARARLHAAAALAAACGDARTLEVASLYGGFADLVAGDRSAALRRLRDALASAERANNSLHVAVICAYLATALAADGRIVEAAATAAQATLELRGLAPWAAVARVALGHVQLARAQDALRRGDADDAARNQALAEQALAETAPLRKSSDDVRFVSRLLERARAAAPRRAEERIRPTLELGDAAAWWSINGGPRVDLMQREVLRSVVQLLARARAEHHAARVGVDALQGAVARGEERLPPPVLRSRLHVALGQLRDLGLRDVIALDDRGYYLDAMLVTAPRSGA